MLKIIHRSIHIPKGIDDSKLQNNYTKKYSLLTLLNSKK